MCLLLSGVGCRVEKSPNLSVIIPLSLAASRLPWRRLAVLGRSSSACSARTRKYSKDRCCNTSGPLRRCAEGKQQSSVDSNWGTSQNKIPGAHERNILVSIKRLGETFLEQLYLLHVTMWPFCSLHTAVSRCGTMAIGWTDYFLLCIAEKCRSARGGGIGGVRSTVEEGLGRICGGTSKGNKKTTGKSWGPPSPPPQSVLISSLLQRQAFNYHYTPESF